MDLNADLGESFGRWTLGDDEAMLGLVTSANVACGFHAGDPSTLRVTTTGAAGAGVVAEVVLVELAERLPASCQAGMEGLGSCGGVSSPGVDEPIEGDP